MKPDGKKIRTYSMASAGFEGLYFLFVASTLDLSAPDLVIVVMDLCMYLNIPFAICLFIRALQLRRAGLECSIMWPIVAVAANLGYWVSIGYVLEYLYF